MLLRIQWYRIQLSINHLRRKTRHYITPDDLPQNLLFDDLEAHWIFTGLTPSARRILSEGWQGVFRRTVLKCLPAPQLAQQFSEAFGRPTKEIYSMIGLLVIMEFKQWTAVVPPKVARPSRSGPLSDP